MPLVTKKFNQLGLHGRSATNNRFIIGLIGTWLRGLSRDVSIFEEFDNPDRNDILFTSLTGSLVNAISLGTEKTILRRLYVKEDEQGSREFILELNELPTIPFARGTVVDFQVNGETLFTGYIWRSPEPGTNENGYFIFSGFGMRKKLEKQIIDENEIYRITDISQSGSNTTYTIDGTFDTSIQTGQRVLVSGCENRQNDANGIITGITSNTLTIANNGVTEPTPFEAELKVLPLEWSVGSTLLSDLLIQVIETYDAGTTGVKYDSSRIETTSDAIIGGNTGIDLHQMTIWKFMESIRPSLNAKGYELGVDREGYYFLKTRSEEITDVKFIGFDANEFDIETDLDGVINSVTIGRKKGKSEGGAGFKIAASAEDDTSIALYTRNHKKLEIPGYLTNEFAEDYADSYIELNKDPKVKASVSRLTFDGAVEFAQHGIAIPPYQSNRVLNIMDNFDGWVTDSAIARSLSTLVLVSGSASHKLEFDSDSFQLSHILYFDEVVKIYAGVSFSFWVRSNKVGSIVKFTYGNGSDFEEEFSVIIAENGVWQEVVIELEEFSNDLEYVGFLFENTEDNTEVYLDRITVVDFYSQRYNLPIAEVEYDLSPSGDITKVTYGQPFDKLDDLISGILSQMENFKLLLRET